MSRRRSPGRTGAVTQLQVSLRVPLQAILGGVLLLATWTACGPGETEAGSGLGAVSSQASSRVPDSLGQEIYNTHCLACHQADGRGVPAMNPPLAGSEVVSGPPKPLIDWVLLGKVPSQRTDSPKQWRGVMPSYRFLSDTELAAVLTHIRKTYGRDAGPITEEQVAAER